VAFVEQAVMRQFRVGYVVARHVVTVAEARGYATAPNVLLAFTAGAAHWFERLEDVVADTRRAQEGLLRAGDPHMVGYCRYVLGIQLVDAAPTLTDLTTEVEAGIAYATRTGNLHVSDMLLPIRQLARALRGETEAPESFADESFDEPAFVPRLDTNPTAALVFHAMHGIAEILGGGMSRLIAHAAAATVLLPGKPGLYSGAITQLVRGFALAEQIRTAAPADERVIADLAACRDWFAGRAVDAPGNFAHVAHLIAAEQAWALGDARAAAPAFDAAIRTAETTRRPWHRALIYERAALFHTAHGLEHTGRILLAEARHAYQTWGATAKTRQLDAAHPDLPGPPTEHRTDHRRDTRGSVSISTDTIDLLAVLNASQALSSETNLDRLRARVTESLSAMTGATDVRLLLHHADADDWHLPTTSEQDIPLAEAGALGLVPLSVVRYVERTREPLTIDDATRDDRFGRDPHLAGLQQCSLLAMPIFAGGSARAMLLLENRLSRGAFTAERLSTVTLIAGQLAVSVDNALLYASLERKVADRTATSAALVEELEWRNRELEAFSGSVSHDLRGPLQVISSFAEHMLDDEEEPLTAESRRRLGRIQTAAERMADLVESLLILARANRGQLRRTSFDLTATAWQVIGDLESHDPQHQVSFTVQDTMTADADEGLVRVILENLINNAVKFTRKIEHPAVEIGRTPRGFFVRDNGAGFPAGKAAELFQPFTRLHNAEDFPGTGIGLTTVHRAVERHGGHTWAEGEDGQGATFWFTLPSAASVTHDRRAEAQRSG
jgi:signal transduction histidine kinase